MISTVSPYLKIEIPYPTTTTKNAVTFVKAIFSAKLSADVKQISAKSKKNPIQIKDS